MPIENIIKSQKQGKLFGYKLKEELNSNTRVSYSPWFCISDK